MNRALLIVLIAAVLPAGCTTSTSPAPASSPSAGWSLTDLRDAATSAGYGCPNWSEEDLNRGSCSGQDLFMVFTDEPERRDAYAQLSGYVENGLIEAVLFGPMWAINGDPARLSSIATALGGELLESPESAPESEPEVGDVCESARGTTDFGDLLRASVDLANGRMHATFEFAQEPDLATEFGVYIMAVNYERGTGSYQAGVKWIDGVTQGPFIFDMSASKQTNYPPSDVEVNGSTVEVSFDGAPFERLGDGWQWRVTVSGPDGDADACPGGVEDFLIYPN